MQNHSQPAEQFPSLTRLHLINKLKGNTKELQAKIITAGFDGFVDSIVKIIKSKEEDQSSRMFREIKEFGEYILEKAGSGFSLELEEISIKLGGNMPIMANALARMGIRVNCIGALGVPVTHSVFRMFPPHCHLYSFADPGSATAYEFNDGKMMLAQMRNLNTSGWEKIKTAIGLDTLIKLYRESDLLCIVNWSEIDASTDIWKGLLNEIFPRYDTTLKQQIVFFDLSDCSKRSTSSIEEALHLLDDFGKYANVVLSLNRNEAYQLHRVIYGEYAENDLASVGAKIYKKLQVGTLLLHSSSEAISIDAYGSAVSKSFYTDLPFISTGAGDNFNAGYCAAQLLRMDKESSLMFANAVSGIYIRSGVSPGLPDIIDFLYSNESK